MCAFSQQIQEAQVSLLPLPLSFTQRGLFCPGTCPISDQRVWAFFWGSKWACLVIFLCHFMSLIPEMLVNSLAHLGNSYKNGFLTTEWFYFVFKDLDLRCYASVSEGLGCAWLHIKVCAEKFLAQKVFIQMTEWWPVYLLLLNMLSMLSDIETGLHILWWLEYCHD